MTWQFDSALQRGKTLQVKISNVVDDDEVNSRTLSWTRSKDQPGDTELNEVEYKAMIKSEIKALLKSLNTGLPTVDISSEINPSNG